MTFSKSSRDMGSFLRMSFLVRAGEVGELEGLKGATQLLEKISWIEAEVSTAELYQGQNTLSQLNFFWLKENFLGFPQEFTLIEIMEMHCILEAILSRDPSGWQ